MSNERELNTIGVIGAGVMGAGVAQNLAQTGHRVILLDLGEAELKRCLQEIRGNLRMHSLLSGKKDGKKEKTKDVLARIETVTEYDSLAEADFVVENVVEKWDVKAEVYPRLDAVCPEHCVFAANTSCVPITRLGSITNRPDRVLGMHFMNPVPLKPVVEVIRGRLTSDESLDVARRFLAGMDKEAIVVNDSPGFVSNRVLMLTINEAIFTVHDGTAEPADVDRLFKTCFGHKMGPLETGDLIGLDTILDSLIVLWENYRDPKFRPCPLLERMVWAGELGRKSGKGFYDYEV